MQAQYPSPELPLNLPTINVAYSPVSVLTVATAKDLIASGDLTTNGAKQLFNPAVWPQLEPEIERIPFDLQKAQCFRNCVAYLMAGATALRSERRQFDALKYIDMALTLEALTHSGYVDV
ncbi:hypothetical protein HRE53_31460 (plasmid) [Acaryochloris sp. 'Moss Beach']|nr:hypothetical protein HRE53_31460 [Acaryochloris sp. 'Moss Beach']